MTASDFPSWMAGIQERTEVALVACLPSSQVAPLRLHEAMRYAVLGGGKRVRPLLAHAAGELAGADLAAVDRVACAVELIHAYSLVHDDMPCMDNDVLRRGKPTCHVEYDDATALLAGDALQALAFQILAEPPVDDQAARALDRLQVLATAAGSRGMAGGQAMDLASVGKSLTLPELELMHIHKTGALIRAAVTLGASCGSLPERAMAGALDHFAKQVGLLFQVVDDILDAESTTATLGKTAGKDRDNNKPTFVSLMGLAGARAFAESLHAEAKRSLDPFGANARRLRELTQFLAHREF